MVPGRSLVHPYDAPEAFPLQEQVEGRVDLSQAHLMRGQPVQLQLLVHAFLGEDRDVDLGLEPSQGRPHDGLAVQEVLGRQAHLGIVLPHAQDDRLAVPLRTPWTDDELRPSYNQRSMDV